MHFTVVQRIWGKNCPSIRFISQNGKTFFKTTAGAETLSSNPNKQYSSKTGRTLILDGEMAGWLNGWKVEL